MTRSFAHIEQYAFEDLLAFQVFSSMQMGHFCLRKKKARTGRPRKFSVATRIRSERATAATRTATSAPAGRCPGTAPIARPLAEASTFMFERPESARVGRLIEIHDLDDAQVVVGTDQRKDHGDDGQPHITGSDHRLQHRELGEKPIKNGTPAIENIIIIIIAANHGLRLLSPQSARFIRSETGTGQQQNHAEGAALVSTHR